MHSALVQAVGPQGVLEDSLVLPGTEPVPCDRVERIFPPVLVEERFRPLDVDDRSGDLDPAASHPPEVVLAMRENLGLRGVGENMLEPTLRPVLVDVAPALVAHRQVPAPV